jgi:hypothetical protein
MISAFIRIMVKVTIAVSIGLESREYGSKDPSRWPRGTRYPQKLALTSPTCCGCSVGIVHLRTQAMELQLYVLFCYVAV